MPSRTGPLASSSAERLPVPGDRTAAPLGILMFESTVPPEPHDVRDAGIFPFPVRYGVVPRTAVIRVAHSGDDALLATFIHAAAGLVDQGCLGIATTCSFLARWQAELAMSLSVPVLSSSLLQVPLVQRLLPHRQHVGIVIRSAIEVDATTLQLAGIDPYGPIEAVDPDGYFSAAQRDDAPLRRPQGMEADVVAAARRLVGAHPHVGAIVLECASMSPYRDAVAAALDIPVFGAAQLFAWFYAGLRGAKIQLETHRH